MKTNHLVVAIVLGFASSIAHAATVWLPTSQDSDFIELDFGNIDLNGAALALFDDSDVGFTDPLYIGNGPGGLGTGGGEVRFDPPPPAAGDILVTSFDTDGVATGDTLLLSDSHRFMLAITRDQGNSWLTDTFWEEVGTDTFLIRFDEEMDCPRIAIEAGNGDGRCMTKAAVLGVDLQPIPIPAAVWLFGSGLLGLVAVARRRA